MLINGPQFRLHRPWIALSTVILLASVAWFVLAGWNSARWPGGGSVPGLTFGLVGGGIILFETFLWPRKKLRTWRIGRVKHWMSAHLWLGLLCLPLLVLHSGFRLGGTLTTLLMADLVVVVASGIWGLAMQQVIPRMMLDELPAETIYNQIDRLAGMLADEADDLVAATCGVEVNTGLPADETAEPEEKVGYVTVGAVRSVGKLSGKIVQARVPATMVAGSVGLRILHESLIGPYLRAGGRSSPLGSAQKAALVFGDLRIKLDTAALPAIETLEGLVDQRRQFDRQIRLHRLLHGWLMVHLPLSIILVLLMAIHVWDALRYW
ncbi:hypothetical protein EP7_003866 [Isosphaeraceae bacterium EP7]